MPEYQSRSESQSHWDWVCLSHTEKHMKILSKLCQKMENLINVGHFDLDIDPKLTVLGDPNLKYIRNYWYESSLSISLYLNINSRVNLSPTRNVYI